MLTAVFEDEFESWAAGLARLGVLKTLNASALNSRVVPSRGIGKIRPTAMLVAMNAGPRSELRPTSPSVPKAGVQKAAGATHSVPLPFTVVAPVGKLGSFATGNRNVVEPCLHLAIVRDLTLTHRRRSGPTAVQDRCRLLGQVFAHARELHLGAGSAPR